MLLKIFAWGFGGNLESVKATSVGSLPAAATAELHNQCYYCLGVSSCTMCSKDLYCLTFERLFYGHAAYCVGVRLMLASDSQ